MSGEEMNDKQKTSNCNMHEALVSYLYDEATPEESNVIRAHVAECGACKQELHAFERVRSMLQQWQLDDLPVVRVVAERPRSMLTMLKELFSITPVWAKALGTVAAAMVLLAVVGTDVSVGQGGFSFHADLLRRGRTVEPANLAEGKTSKALDGASLEQVRAEVRGFVSQLIADSERQHNEEIKLQLINLESQLENMHSADLAKLATRIQEHQQRLKTIERDIDRRDGLDLTDILFSETSKPVERSTGGSD